MGLVENDDQLTVARIKKCLQFLMPAMVRGYDCLKGRNDHVVC
jgi:hypothetical protein